MYLTPPVNSLGGCRQVNTSLQYSVIKVLIVEVGGCIGGDSEIQRMSRIQSDEESCGCKQCSRQRESHILSLRHKREWSGFEELNSF